MIPLVKPILGKREKQLINEVIDSGIIASGKYVEEFEKKFTKLSKAKYGVVCSSGTTALHTALLACGIKPGDKVLFFIVEQNRYSPILIIKLLI